MSHGFKSIRQALPRGCFMAWSVVVVLAPSILKAQALGEASSPSEAWRGELHKQLDQQLAELGAAPACNPLVTAAVTRDDYQEVIIQPIRLPAFGPSRRERWLPSVANILSDHGLPPSLMGVAAIESGFNPSALSSKGARGLWQLMPETARRYGLVVTPQRDERLDPMKSTHAAAQYMKDLYAQFEDWPLALAAYNAGGDRVARAMQRVGANDFWTLSSLAALPGETRRYVPAVLENTSVLLAAPRWSGTPATPNPADPHSLLSPRTVLRQVMYATTSPRNSMDSD